MSVTELFVVVALTWLATGLALAVALGRRGHSSFTWFLLGAILGPLAIGLAFYVIRHPADDTVRVVAPSPVDDVGGVDVLAGFDGSPESRAAVDGAIELLGTRLGRLTLATVVPFDGGLDDERRAVESLEAEGVRLAWLSPALEVLHGDPATSLTDRASEDGYEVVVAGTRGAGRSRLLGSAASALAQRSKIPVLLLGDAA